MALATAASNLVLDSYEPSIAGSSSLQYKLHPSFSSNFGDVILYAVDGVAYRMHSYTLRMASGFFFDMFTLPQPSPPTTTEEGIHSANKLKHVPTYENSDILTLFLTLITGIPINTPLHEWGLLSPSTPALTDSPAITTSCFHVIDRVLRLAENWDAAGPISYIRSGLLSPEMVDRNPLRVYAIASHFGWDHERNIAAQYTLKLDLFLASDIQTQENLERLASKDIMSLFRLRYRRKEELRELLEDPDRFSVGNTENSLCAKCKETPLDNKTWRLLKEAMIMEIDRRPLGDSIIGFDVGGIGGEDFVGGILAWPEAQACFAATCVKEECGGLNYDQCATLKEIQDCVDTLSWDL
ncbi:hypothetical protein D9757_007541 [Collybiopsis confluens]|uniref:BTB domain-containing protein n=1 Tax=Collybiopsis confluens TaxID=2823264 RepID=A0A8H5HER0_9AGAR|nr:hypothetical protein D9757_007541 [Collybiopsis confluens]